MLTDVELSDNWCDEQRKLRWAKDLRELGLDQGPVIWDANEEDN